MAVVHRGEPGGGEVLGPSDDSPGMVADLLRHSCLSRGLFNRKSSRFQFAKDQGSTDDGCCGIGSQAN